MVAWFNEQGGGTSSITGFLFGSLVSYGINLVSIIGLWDSSKLSHQKVQTLKRVLVSHVLSMDSILILDLVPVTCKYF